MKEIKKDKVFQYTGMYIPVEDEEGIVHMIRKKEFENNYKIVE